VEQITNILKIHEIRVRKKNIDLKIGMAQNFYEVQILTIVIVGMPLFVFDYKVKSEKNELENLNVLFLTLVNKKT
jgi:hypothetical protein